MYPILFLAPLAFVAPASGTSFLVVVLDDVGADKISAYRADMYPGQSPVNLPATPAIDDLARVGLRFSHAWANPVCSPSRASLLTGMYPFQHDVGTVIGAGPDLGSTAVSLPEVLDTVNDGERVWFGKWHLGTTTPGGTDWSTSGQAAEPPTPGLHGFTRYDGGLGGQLDSYTAWTEVRWPVALASGGVGATIAIDTTWGTDVTFGDALDWAETASGDWLAVVSPNAPHVDADGRREAWEMDDLAPSDLGQCADRNGDHRCTNTEIYTTLVEDVDDRIGALLDGMAAADPERLEDTVIVLVGDNGSPVGVLEAPWVASGTRTSAGKSTTYESGVRVPLLLARGCDWMDQADGAFDGYYGGTAVACLGASVELATPGLVVDLPVEIEDILPTLAALAGAPAAVSGVSLAPCLDATEAQASDCGSASLAARPVYTETFTRPGSAAAGFNTTGRALSGTAAIRQGALKILARMDTSSTPSCMVYEFYDLSADPFEVQDLRAGTLTTEQSAAYEALWLRLRTDVAPDWFAARDCAADSAWDVDHDSYETSSHGGSDCNDTNAAIHPGAREVWYDGVDTNCDGRDDYDKDGDGYAAVRWGGTDCNDSKPGVHPGAAESGGEGVDSNCNGSDDT